MAYQGYEFIFDGIPSSRYGLLICSFDSSGYRYTGGSEMEIKTDRSARSLKTILLSSAPSTVLQFELEIMAKQQLNIYEADVIKSWLFGQIKYKKLSIIKDDMMGIYFNCLLNEPEDVQIDGNNGWKFTVICDAGGAWEDARTKRFTPSDGGTIIFNNISGNNDYTYPTVKFALGDAETDFSIKNKSDNNRQFTFAGLNSTEVITVDCEHGVITSSESLNRLNKFNKNLLRLKRGINELECTGDISYLEITTQSFRRLGG